MNQTGIKSSVNLHAAQASQAVLPGKVRQLKIPSIKSTIKLPIAPTPQVAVHDKSVETKRDQPPESKFSRFHPLGEKEDCDLPHVCLEDKSNPEHPDQPRQLQGDRKGVYRFE